MDREKINGWDEVNLTQILTGYILVFDSVSGFEMNTSCIKSIKASNKVKSSSKSHMWGMSKYMEAEREAEKEARKETSRIEAA